MPELLIELFSEEIPARMQARAAEDLCGLLLKALAPLIRRASASSTALTLASSSRVQSPGTPSDCRCAARTRASR